MPISISCVDDIKGMIYCVLTDLINQAGKGDIFTHLQDSFELYQLEDPVKFARSVYWWSSKNVFLPRYLPNLPWTIDQKVMSLYKADPSAYLSTAVNSIYSKYESYILSSIFGIRNSKELADFQLSFPQ